MMEPPHPAASKGLKVLVESWDSGCLLSQTGTPKCPKVPCQVEHEYNYLLLFGLLESLMRQINNITAPNQPFLIFLGSSSPMAQ